MSIASFIHRHVWKYLPYKLRRRVLYGIISLFAPRLSRQVLPKSPIIVVGVLSNASGTGQSARLCHDALKASGLRVYGIDITTDLMQEKDCPGFDFENGDGLNGPGTMIIHVNAPLIPLALKKLGHRLVSEKYIVGYWAWELPQMPQDWFGGLAFVHEVWVPSKFTASAVAKLDCELPIHVVPHPVAMKNAPKIVTEKNSSRPYTVLMIFNMASSFARKNPCAVIHAFDRAFGNDPATCLIIKVTGSSTYSEGMTMIRHAMGANENIVIIENVMSSEEIADLYMRADVLISLHRSEGFGLTLAEAMFHGIPTIATDWSGNTDFATPETGIPVDYNLIPATDPQGTYDQPGMVWADAKIDEAADALLLLYNDKKLSKKLGRAGEKNAADMWSSERYASTVSQILGL